MKNKPYLFKSLFSTTLMGLLAVIGLSQANLMAAGNSSYQTKSDDTKIIHDEDGSLIEIQPDGSKTIKKPDGTSVQINSDGTKIIHDADGTLIEIKPDGSKTIKKTDGTTVQVQSAKSNANK